MKKYLSSILITLFLLFPAISHGINPGNIKVDNQLEVSGTSKLSTLKYSSATTLTIATGAVTKTQTMHRIDTEGAAASDGLDTINGGVDGDVISVRAEHADRTVVLKHSTGNLLLAGSDIPLEDTTQYVSLTYDGTLSKWVINAGAPGAAAGVSDEAYGPTWNGITTIAPSKNAVYDGLAPKATPIFTGQATIPTINLTGGQIAFPATAVPSADANTLDDYEEGTFNVAFTAGAGTVTISSAYDTFSYTKIGRQVSVQGHALVGSVSFPSGSLHLTGLPFALASLSEGAGSTAASIGYLTDWVGSINMGVARANAGQTFIYIEEFTGDTNANAAEHMQATSQFYLQMTYFTE